MREPWGANNDALRHTGTTRVRGCVSTRPLALDPTGAQHRAARGSAPGAPHSDSRGVARQPGTVHIKPGRGGRCSRPLGARPGDGLRGRGLACRQRHPSPGDSHGNGSGVGEPVVAPCARKAGTPAADLAGHRGDGGPAPGNPRPLDPDGAQRGYNKKKPTSCSTGQASLASHSITSGCSLDSRRKNWTERESCDLWDGKLRQTVVSALRGRPRLNYLNLQLAQRTRLSDFLVLT